MEFDVFQYDSTSTDKRHSCWYIKEQIRKEQDLLKQDRSYFYDTYKSGDKFIAENEGEVLGFGIITTDVPYLAILAVDPNFQDMGVGSTLVSEMINKYGELSCHTRISNDSALEFYKSLEFEIEGTENSYYRDGENAVFLTFSKSTE